MHMAPLTAAEKQRARAWMKATRNGMSQEDLAAQLTAFFGDGPEPWSITRDRYSKYESGKATFSREMLDRFVTFWAAQGQPGPDLSEPTPVLSLEERQVIALERAAELAAQQVEETRRQTAMLEQVLMALAQGRTLGHEAQVVRDRLAGSASTPPVSDQAPVPG